MSSNKISSNRCLTCPFRTATIEPLEVRKSDLLLVGEAPGKTEVRYGKAFIGESGKLLFKALTRLGIDREECSITNALSCFIPQTDYAKKSSTVRQCITGCHDRLMKEVERTEPKIILALGNVAMHSLLQDHTLKITKERGSAREFEYNGTKCLLVPTLHPAAILRNPNDFRKLAVDLQYAIGLLNGRAIKSPGETKYEVVEPENVRSVLNSLAGETLAADIETTGLDPRKCQVLVIGLSPRKNFVYVFPPDTFPELKRYFKSTPDLPFKLVWQNGKFDTGFLVHHGFGKVPLHDDTMLLHYTLNEQKATHDLEQLAMQELGAGDYKKKFRKKTDGYDFSTAETGDLHKYLAEDCDYTRQLFSIYKPRVDADSDLKKFYENCCIPASNFLTEVENTGIWVNLSKLGTLDKYLIGEIDTLHDTIQTIAEPYWDPIDYMVETDAKGVVFHFNPGSWQQLAWVMYDSMNLKPANGKRNTNAETLATIPPSQFVDSILEWRQLGKVKGTYVDNIARLISTDGRIHSTFNIPGTETGRLSSSDPNIQNIPVRSEIGREVRKIFEAEGEKNTLLEIDMSQAELRILAAFSRDPLLLDVYTNGRDLHSETAERIFGPDWTKDHRATSKTVNFGVVYGLVAKNLVDKINCTMDQAQAIIDGWYNTFPKARDYILEQREMVKQGKSLTTPFGNRRRFPLVTQRSLYNLQNEGSNFRIQATASLINLMYAIDLAPKLDDDVKIINLVHDSILFELPNDSEKINKTFKLAKESMDHIVDKWLATEVPFEIDAKIGKSWGETMELELVA